MECWSCDQGERLTVTPDKSGCKVRVRWCIYKDLLGLRMPELREINFRRAEDAAQNFFKLHPAINPSDSPQMRRFIMVPRRPEEP